MVRFSRAIILFAVCAVCAASLLWMFRNNRVGDTNGAVTDIHQMNAESLEREIRKGLPIGIPRAAAETFLNKRGIEFSFEAPSKFLYATARKLKGGTFIVSESLTLKFRFDDALKLRSIDTKVVYTGP